MENGAGPTTRRGVVMIFYIAMLDHAMAMVVSVVKRGKKKEKEERGQMVIHLGQRLVGLVTLARLG